MQEEERKENTTKLLRMNQHNHHNSLLTLARVRRVVAKEKGSNGLGTTILDWLSSVKRTRRQRISQTISGWMGIPRRLVGSSTFIEENT